MKVSEVKLAVALPSYDGRRHNTLPLLALQKRVAFVAGIDMRASLLAHGFNQCLVKGMELMKAGLVTHFLMIHDDIIPTGEDWFDRLWHEYEQSKANLICAVS